MTPTLSSPTAPPSTYRSLLALWAGYLAFVVYGSLVPFAFRPLPFAEAYARFLDIPMLALGVQSRADWIANGVLYVPLAFLSAQLLLTGTTRARLPRLLAAAAFCAALAIGVEFAQIYYPPRTVSLNDIVAEFAGTLLGVALVTHTGNWFATLLDTDAARLRHRLLEAYLAIYLALSLFPYDLLLSSAELAAKLNGDNWGWLTSANDVGIFRLAAKSGVEILLTLPVGFLLGARATRRTASYGRAVLWGIVLGGGIELAQFFTYSGITQGLSILTRVIGVVIGLALWYRRAAFPAQRIRVVIARSTTPLALLYIVTLLFVNGWVTPRWNDVEAARERLVELHFLPFYYHYYTTEMHALVSALTTLLAYLPIGVLVWARNGSARQAVLAAILVAGIVEGGKLFIAGLRPDPTNLLLAAAGAWGATRVARLFGVADGQGDTRHDAFDGAPAATAHVSPHPPPAPLPPPTPIAYAVLLGSLAFAAYAAARFPAHSALLGAVLVAAIATVWWRPAWLIAVVVTALPVFDLAPWSGRFFFDEFDLLLIVVVIVGIARCARTTRREKHDRLFAVMLGLLAASFAISSLRGVFPWPALDANAFSNYFSPFNALRISKGLAWAILLYALLRRQIAAGADVRTPLAWGICSGLTLTVAVVLWERVAFSGLFNFATDYRVTGPFSAMHTGGAYIECFLAIALPFLVLAVLQNRNWAIRIAGTLLLLLTTYALMVTFSRNGYLAFGSALIVILFFALFRSSLRRRNAFFAAALGIALVAVALPVFTGQYAQRRMATVDRDLGVRQKHWRDALEMRTSDWATTLFGVGLGRFPEYSYLFAHDSGRTASYQFKEDNANRYLRLRSGSSLYFEQLVAVVPGQRYRLALDARSEQPNAALTVPICEKWLLSSFNCSWNGFKPGDKAGNGNVGLSGSWRHFESTVSTDRFHRDSWYSRRPVKLALYNGAQDAVIDVDNVSLVRLDGDRAENLLHNGDFSAGIDHWFFSVDSHLQWHTKSLPVALLFDQGWFGAIVFCLFALSAFAHAAHRAWHNDLYSAAALASLAAFLVVGLFDTLIDSPRFLLLFVILGAAPWLVSDSASSSNREMTRK